MSDQLPHALTPLTLTGAEREAVRFAAAVALPDTEKLGGVAGELCRMHAATLRGLLERLSTLEATMADGKGCKCAAYSESECGCDADWTPQEVYDLRAESQHIIEAKNAEIERLRAERRWIPVSERLPPEETRVIAYDGEDVFESEYWDGGWDWELDADVSHWIPLPEPPSRWERSSPGSALSMADLLADARETLADISSRRPGQTHYEGCRTEHVGCLLAELAAEVERLREAIRRIADQDATLSILCKRDGSQVVTVTMDATLTDAEREAVEECYEWAMTADHRSLAATLRGLLERL